MYHLTLTNLSMMLLSLREKSQAVDHLRKNISSDGMDDPCCGCAQCKKRDRTMTGCVAPGESAREQWPVSKTKTRTGTDAAVPTRDKFIAS
jgi:hypothetical protein